MLIERFDVLDVQIVRAELLEQRFGERSGVVLGGEECLQFLIKIRLVRGANLRERCRRIRLSRRKAWRRTIGRRRRWRSRSTRLKLVLLWLPTDRREVPTSGYHLLLGLLRVSLLEWCCLRLLLIPLLLLLSLLQPELLLVLLHHPVLMAVLLEQTLLLRVEVALVLLQILEHLQLLLVKVKVGRRTRPGGDAAGLRLLLWGGAIFLLETLVGGGCGRGIATLELGSRVSITGLGVTFAKLSQLFAKLT